MQKLILGQIFNRLSKRCLHTERKVKLDRFGVNINFVQTGDGKRNVLLLPGSLGSTWTDFQPQIEKLPKLLPDHTIIAWDPPGYGKSIPPEREFPLDFHNRDAIYAVELMRTLGKQKFSMLGWSSGGITAQIIASCFADHVEKLVFWGAGSVLLKKELEGFCDLRDVSKWSPRMRDPLEKLYGKERLLRLWAGWISAMENIYAQRGGDFCRNELVNIKAPTFLMHGCKDPVIAADHAEYMKKEIKNIRYHEFPEGKHNIHLQYADEFNKLVVEFLLQEQ